MKGNVSKEEFLGATENEQGLEWQEALRLAYKKKNPEPLKVLLEKRKVTLHAVFFPFLDPKEKNSTQERGELQKKKEFAKLFFTKELGIPEKTMMYLLLQHGDVHATWVYALMQAEKEIENDSTVLELRKLGASPSLAASALIEERALAAKEGTDTKITSNELNRILSLKEITGETAGYILTTAVRCHDLETFDKLRDREIPLNTAFRAATLLPDILWGFGLLKKYKSDILADPLLYSLDKFYLTLAKHGNLKQLNKAKHFIKKEVKEIEIKNLLLGNLIIGYARLGEPGKVKNILNSFSEEKIISTGVTHTPEESRIVRLANHSGAVLFNAIKSGCLETVRVAVEAGANVNIRVPETGNYPLKAAVEAGKKEIIEYLITMGATYPENEALTNLDIAIEYFSYKKGHANDVEEGKKRYAAFQEIKKCLNGQDAEEGEVTPHQSQSNATFGPPRDLTHKFLLKQISRLVTEQNKGLHEAECQSLIVKVLNEIDSSPVGKKPKDNTYLYRDEGKLLRTKHCKEMVEKCVQSVTEKECISRHIHQCVMERSRDLLETERQPLIVKIQNEIDSSPVGEGPEDNTYLYQQDGAFLRTKHSMAIVEECTASVLVKESIKQFQGTFFGRRLIEAVITKVLEVHLPPTEAREEKTKEFYKEIIVAVLNSIFAEKNIGEEKGAGTVLYREKAKFKLGRTTQWQEPIRHHIEHSLQEYQETQQKKSPLLPPIPPIPRLGDIPQSPSDAVLEFKKSKERRHSLTLPARNNRINSARGAGEDVKKEKDFPPVRYREKPTNVPPTHTKEQENDKPNKHKTHADQLLQERQKNNQKKDDLIRN